MAVSWSVNLEHGPRWWYAHVAELPGCFTRGETREAVLDALPSAIEIHKNRLLSRGIAEVPLRSGLSFVEVAEGVPELGESGGAVALFRSDRAAVDGEGFRAILQLMALNRETLLSMVQSLSGSHRKARIIPGKRTVNEDLRHVANAEEWYISRMGGRWQQTYVSYLDQNTGKGQDHIERLNLVRQGVVHTLTEAFPEFRDEVFRRPEYTRHPEEEWTYRKVLRRFVEHEWEHVGTISRLLERPPLVSE